ncbi:hypothetical protein Bbelb_050130 [Branchiostoma belcheri]|nr:hypothetical protein Bbelb_050130 [Branchiostoma belcheri]
MRKTEKSGSSQGSGSSGGVTLPWIEKENHVGSRKAQDRKPARFSDFTDDLDLADDLSHDSDALSAILHATVDLEELRLDIQRTKDDRTTPKEPVARQSSGHKRSSFSLLAASRRQSRKLHSSLEFSSTSSSSDRSVSSDTSYGGKDSPSRKKKKSMKSGLHFVHRKATDIVKCRVIPARTPARHEGRGCEVP